MFSTMFVLADGMILFRTGEKRVCNEEIIDCDAESYRCQSSICAKCAVRDDHARVWITRVPKRAI